MSLDNIAEFPADAYCRGGPHLRFRQQSSAAVVKCFSSLLFSALKFQQPSRKPSHSSSPVRLSLDSLTVFLMVLLDLHYTGEAPLFMALARASKLNLPPSNKFRAVTTDLCHSIIHLNLLTWKVHTCPSAAVDTKPFDRLRACVGSVVFARADAES